MAYSTSYNEYYETIRKYWQDMDIYNCVNEPDQDIFRFMDGPPFPSGDMHLGHVMIAFIKDSIIRYNLMHQKYCLNKIGYDCHGVPTEMKACRELALKTIKDIHEFGIDNFNKYCCEMVNKTVNSWVPLYEKMGRWANFDVPYKTQDVKYMESVWWVFKQLFDKKLVYNSSKVVPYSIGCATPLSNFEACEKYKDVKTESVYAYFPLVGEENTGFVIWTTTPWTLPANMALCVNPNELYVKIFCNNRWLIVAEKCVKNIITDPETVHIYKYGRELINTKYQPPFTYLDHTNYIVLADDYVNCDEGVSTGIVHLAPAFGDDDFRVCVNNKLLEPKDALKYCPVDETGVYTNIITDYAGKNVFSVDKLIIAHLKINNRLIKTLQYTHKYPFCYRTDTPLMYRAYPAWYIKVTQLKDQLLEMNKKITWIPQHIGQHRFNNWLENCRDWCVSRERFFGTPMPLWVSDDGEEIIAVGSIDELVTLAGLSEYPTDIHRQFVDNITIPSQCGKGMLKNAKKSLDCWFESGCVPYGQLHYPFENKEILDNTEYLSDFICEGIDQTRGWFYTLLVISTALFNKPAYKTVMCAGLILDETGLKISKKFGNFVNPGVYIDNFGSDFIRLYLLSSPATKADSLKFSEESVDKLKKRFIPFINAVKFFEEYYHVYFLKYGDLEFNNVRANNVIDAWILSKCCLLAKDINKFMQNYDLEQTIMSLTDFVNDLTNWYIKIKREILKGKCEKALWEDSLRTLYTVLVYYTKLLAPFAPFLGEHINSKLVHVISIFKTKYPDGTEFPIDTNAIRYVTVLQNIYTMVRTLRSDHKVNLKIPIKHLYIYTQNNVDLDIITSFGDLLNDLNCIDITMEEFKDSLTYKFHPNTRSLGIKYRANSTNICNMITTLPSEFIEYGTKNNLNAFTLKIKKETFVISIKDDILKTEILYDKRGVAMFQDNILVCIDFSYDETIHEMYQVKLIARAIQIFRKVNKLHPWNKIYVQVNNLPETLFPQIEQLIKSPVTGGMLSKECTFLGKIDNHEYTHYNGNILNANFSIYLLSE